MKKTKKMELTPKILIALFLGIIIGIIINFMLSQTNESTNKLVNDILINGIFGALGTIFLNCIKMLTIPIVFFSIMVGASQMGDVKQFGRIGSRTIVFYLTTTAIAICIALFLGYIFSPGVGVDMSSVIKGNYVQSDTTSPLETILNIVPNNVFQSFTSANMLQIIFFALVMGIGITSVGEKASTFKKCIEEINIVLLKIMVMVMHFAPYGVFGLLAKTFSTVGLSAIIPLGKYFFVVLLALFIHLIITYMGMLKLIGKVSPVQFLKNIWPVMVFAFSSSSSSATIPVTLDNMHRKQGISPSISSFTIPLGATINMDGTAIMQGVAVVLISQLQGVNLTTTQLITVIIMATLASIGTAGVPSAGLVMLAMVLQGVGLDPSFIGIILGIDRLLDMTRTSINVVGDAVCTLIIAKKENQFDEKIFYTNNKLKSMESDIDSNNL